MVSQRVDKLRRPLSRGLWQYDLSDPTFTEQTVTLDNGRTIEDLAAHQSLITQKLEFLKARQEGMEWKVEPTKQAKPPAAKKKLVKSKRIGVKTRKG